MEKCHTTQIVSSKVSGCLVENPECEYARKFGFSFVCSHPDPNGFQVLETATAKDEALERYDMLRRKRRAEFTNNLDESYRKIFSLQTDFFGQPLTAVDLPLAESGNR